MVTILKPRALKRGNMPPSIADEKLPGTSPAGGKQEPGKQAEKGIELSEPAFDAEGSSSSSGEGPNPTT